MKYLFITGWQRSGTTLMTRMLNAHPKITVVYQPFFDFFQYCIDIFYRDMLKISITQNKPLLDRIEPYHEQLKNSFIDIFFNYEDIERLKQRIKNRVSADEQSAPLIVSHLHFLKPGSAPEVLTELFNLLKNSYGNGDTELVGFKELYCEPFIDIFANLFGNNFFYIQMIRDPRAVYASRNTGSYLKKVGKKYPLLFIIDNWKRSYAYYNRYHDSISSYIPVFYERLVSNPETTLREILRRIDILFDYNVLNHSSYVDGYNRPWHGNSSHHNSFDTIDISAINKWKSILTPTEIGAIEFACKHEMEAIKYKLYSSKFRIFHFLRFQERRSEISNWLAHTDYILTSYRKLLYCCKEFSRRST